MFLSVGTSSPKKNPIIAGKAIPQSLFLSTSLHRDSVQLIQLDWDKRFFFLCGSSPLRATRPDVLL
jgi:hypothetical protein